MDILEIGAILGIVFFALRYMKYFKGAKFVAPKTAGMIAVGLLIASAWYFDWGGLQTKLMSYGQQPSGGEEGAVVTEGATFDVEGSETDANLNYDVATKTFTCSFYDNTENNTPVNANTAATNIDHVTLTLTFYRTDMLPGEDNAVTAFSATVPEYRGTGENNGITYAPVDEDDSTGKYEVAFTPSGGSARDMSHNTSIAPGGSRTVSVVLDLDSAGLTQLDNFDSKDVILHTAGGNFTVRFVKVGETLSSG